mmetsp:Transcript_28775/g.29920  ORF Transcript_28775/g.29920 Transcript_28775/m.29920 type:complete len:104 (+) Transcript_28775:37-348(+)
MKFFKIVFVAIAIIASVCGSHLKKKKCDSLKTIKECYEYSINESIACYWRNKNKDKKETKDTDKGECVPGALPKSSFADHKHYNDPIEKKKKDELEELKKKLA